MDVQARSPLSASQKVGLGCCFLFLIALGGLVEYRSAFLTRRMGDLDVYLRAAWAVRTNADPYAITSANDWHYLYPPLCAILLTPLADPPPGANTAGYVPYPLSVALFYLLNVLCLFFAAHVLASALEERSEDPDIRSQPRYCARWWGLRFCPVLVCLLPIAHTMMRGQVNIIVLAILSAAVAGWLRGQTFRAGIWLAFAICIKVFPVYLLVYPLWKRDGRSLGGCAVGLLAGLIVIPCLYCGPAKTQSHYETYGRVFFAPLFKLNEDNSRTEELLTADSIGVKTAIHNWMHPDFKFETRPTELSIGEKIAYVVLGIVMTFLTLWRSSKVPIAHTLGGLIVLMTIFSPMCRSHYLMFCMPIVMCLLSSQWQYQTTTYVPMLLKLVNTVFALTMAIAYLPGMEILKETCASLFATLPLWALPLVLAPRAPAGVAETLSIANARPLQKAA